ncbi:uncharacterized protein ASCRUDRAFT_20851, partial [Ascoidea rubescens DSM 1968]
WQNIIASVSESVVILKFNKLFNYDIESSGIFKTLGFIVDTKIGLILTCKKIIGIGPTKIFAVFNNFEEILIKPIYIDPVHDFMFLKYDPLKLKFLKANCLNLVSNPNTIKLGLEFKIFCLNNNNLKNLNNLNDLNQFEENENTLNVLSGFVSKLDCNAPFYGPLSYNDFNTEYIQGLTYNSFNLLNKDDLDQRFLTSGSPVLDINGNVIALQTSSFINNNDTSTSTNFFLPLYRINYIFKKIQLNFNQNTLFKTITWVLRTFNECRKLGLQSSIESIAREKFPDINGLLVAKVILPFGPAFNKIREGDILISINNYDICSLIQIDEILDNSINEKISIVVERSGENIKLEIKVQDLFDVSPLKFLDVSGETFNNISYNVARHFNLPVKGVYLHKSNGSFLDIDISNCIIDSVDNNDILTLEDMIEIIKKIPDDKKIAISYRCLKNLNRQYFKITTIDKHWFKSFRVYEFDMKSGLWLFQDLDEKYYLPSLPIKKQLVHNMNFELNLLKDFYKQNFNVFNIIKSFVKLEIRFPFAIDSFPKSIKKCYGLIIDNSKGLVLVSRYYVPHDFCDISVEFNDSLSLPGKAIFLHPFQNYTIIKYDPSLISFESNFISATPNFRKSPNLNTIKKNLSVLFIGYDINFKLQIIETRIKDVTISNNIGVNPFSPYYKGCNIELIKVENNYIQTKCHMGVLCDIKTYEIIGLCILGRQQNAYNESYNMGIDIYHIIGIIMHFRQFNKVPKIRILECEFNTISVLKARIRGLTDERIGSPLPPDGDAIIVQSSHVNNPNTNVMDIPTLQPNDIILSINEIPVNRLADLDLMYYNKILNFTVVRKECELRFRVRTQEMQNTNHILIWSGLILQKPHLAIRQIMNNNNRFNLANPNHYHPGLPSGIFVSDVLEGSPGEFYNIQKNQFITHVNDIFTPDIESFKKVVSRFSILNHKSTENMMSYYLKLKVITLTGVEFVLPIQPNYYYSPTFEFRKDSTQNSWF